MAINCYYINNNSFHGLQISNLNTQELLMHFIIVFSQLFNRSVKPNIRFLIFFLRRRFILHKETNLQKKLHTYFTKSIYSYNGDAIHNIHAGSLRTTSYRSL